MKLYSYFVIHRSSFILFRTTERMPQELLSELGKAADRLKDANGIPIRELRALAGDAWRAAWRDVGQSLRHGSGQAEDFKSAHAAMAQLFDALRNNQLYPYPRFLENPIGLEPGTPMAPDALRDAFNRLKAFCVVNRYGTGEVVLMYVLMALAYGLCRSGSDLYDHALCKSVGDVINLRPPTDPEDNLAPFSDELKMRHHTMLLIHAMKELGCLDNDPVEKPTPEQWAEISDLFAEGHVGDATLYIPDAFRVVFDVLDAGFILMTFARQKDTGSAICDPRSPDDLFYMLQNRLKEIGESPTFGEPRRKRLLKVAVTAMVRVLPHVEKEMAMEMYRFLRKSKRITTIRHGDMFYLMPDRAARLDLLNFLYHHGKMSEDYLRGRFHRYFPRGNLRFVSEKEGFAVDLPTRAHPMSKARYFKALTKRKLK